MIRGSKSHKNKFNWLCATNSVSRTVTTHRQPHMDKGTQWFDGADDDDDSVIDCYTHTYAAILYP